MNRGVVAIALLLISPFAASAERVPARLEIDQPFLQAKAVLHAQGWRADPEAHAAGGDYTGLERLLVQNDVPEVDYCSVDKSLCILQYVKGRACLRVQTQGERLGTMKIKRWSGNCRERVPDEEKDILPAEVRYLAQWRDECEQLGACSGLPRFLHKLKRKYAGDRVIANKLKSY